MSYHVATRAAWQVQARFLAWYACKSTYARKVQSTPARRVSDLAFPALGKALFTLRTELCVDARTWA